jgi:hypothetical protein
MTTRGRVLAGVIGIAVAFLMPKRLPCHFPGQACERLDAGGRLCKAEEVEPLGVWALEWLVRRDVGLAYRRSETCD